MGENKPKPPIHTAIVGRIERPLVWHVSDDIKTTFVTNLTIQHTKDEFIVSLYEVVPPLILTEEDWDNIEGVKAECVGRFVISAGRMETFINALAENFARHKAIFGQEEGDEDGSAAS